MHPAEQHDVLADVAAVSSPQVWVRVRSSERFYVDVIALSERPTAARFRWSGATTAQMAPPRCASASSSVRR